MPVLHVLLDIQHAGQPSRPGDTGAAYDLDSDGVRGERGEREVDLVTGYVTAARHALEAAGARVTILTTGSYDERHTRACAVAAEADGRVAYLACHTNAGGGTYGLVRPDHRSRGGLDLAAHVAETFGRLQELSKVRTDPLFPTGGAAMRGGRDTSTVALVGWWTRGWPCIDGIWLGPANLSGVLVEPGFADAAAHRSLWTPAGLQRIGEALAAGVLQWGRA